MATSSFIKNFSRHPVARERKLIMGSLALMLHPSNRPKVLVTIPPSFRHRD